MKPKMIAAGQICLDFSPSFTCEPQQRLEDLLAPGKLVSVGRAEFHPGGAVANTGLAMKFFGGDVSLQGKIGDDAFGKLLLAEFRQKGSVQGIHVVPGQETAYSVVLAIPGIDRIFLHHVGANDTFGVNDIDYGACRDAMLFHFGYPPVMARMYAERGRELTEIFERVKKCGCMTSLDMAAVDENSAAGQADWEGILCRTLPYVDFFLPSIEELLFMLDRISYYRLLEEADGGDLTEQISIDRDVAPLADKILAMGVKAALIKCGARGFYYKTAGAEAFETLREQRGLSFEGFANQEGFERSFVPERVISGTGAGDTTIAAFLMAVVKGYPFAQCCDLAAATGACCVSTMDALSGLKSFAELEQKIAAGWARNDG